MEINFYCKQSRPTILAFTVYIIKLSRNKKDLNDVTAAPFLVGFLLLAAEKKTLKAGQL